MTPLNDHVNRLREQGGDLLEFELTENVGLDNEVSAGFSVSAIDSLDRVMIVEVFISGDNGGLSATVSTYDGFGECIESSVLSMGHQVMVTLDTLT